ncbi:MAG: hypothetical protein AB2A00_21245 [Myxococcota bacterium]
MTVQLKPQPGRQGLCALLVMMALGCQAPDQWTGRSRLASEVDGQHVEYREYRDPQAPDGPTVLYALRPNANTDVAYLKVLSDRSEYARDDGRNPDRRAADGEYLGRYDIRKHRNNPDWIRKTRPAEVGEVAKTLPSDEEARGEYSHRRFMAGGPSGAFDNAAVCPPHMFQTGIKYRKDRPGRSIAQLAPLCRTEPGLPEASAQGSPWGEDNKSAWEMVQCPPGEALLADGEATLGPWAAYTVLIGLKFKCGSFTDAARPVTRVLEAGFPSEQGQRFRCAETETTTPTPFARGMRIIAGMRVDAIGYLCDVPREQVTPRASTMRYESRPSMSWTLSLPVHGDDVPVEVKSLSRAAAVEGGVLVLPSVVADLELRATGGQPLTVRAVADGCVVRATEDEVVLLHHPTGSACTPGVDAVFTRYRGAKGWRVQKGATVRAGETLAELKEGALSLAVAPAHWLGEGVTGEQGLPEHVALAANVPGNVVSFTLPVSQPDGGAAGE